MIAALSVITSPWPGSTSVGTCATGLTAGDAARGRRRRTNRRHLSISIRHPYQARLRPESSAWTRTRARLQSLQTANCLQKHRAGGEFFSSPALPERVDRPCRWCEGAARSGATRPPLSRALTPLFARPRNGPSPRNAGAREIFAWRPSRSGGPRSTTWRERGQMRLGRVYVRPVGIPYRLVALSGRGSGTRTSTSTTPRSDSSKSWRRAGLTRGLVADHLVVLNMPMAALEAQCDGDLVRPADSSSRRKLAMATKHIGLIATASTTFEPAYMIACRFGVAWTTSSGGRAGWDLVTTSNPDAAPTLGMTEHMEHGERYRRAASSTIKSTGLWDSCRGRVSLCDVEEGIYFNPDRGAHRSTTRASSVAWPSRRFRPAAAGPVGDRGGRRPVRSRSPARRRDGGDGVRQRRQASSTPRPPTPTSRRAALVGRDLDHDQDPPPRRLARRRRHRRRRRGQGVASSTAASTDSGIAFVCRPRSAMTRRFDLDGPLSDIPESNASKPGRQRVIDHFGECRDNMPIPPARHDRRQLEWVSRALLALPKMIVDQMEEWFFSGSLRRLGTS